MSRRGVTLVEILMTVLIMAGVSGVFYSVSVAGDRLWGRASAQMTAIGNTQQALNILGGDLRLAQLSTLSCPSGTVKFRQGTATPIVTYQRIGANLVRSTDDGQPARTVASGLSLFSPTCNTTGLVTVTLAATPDAHYDYQSSAPTLQSSFWVRSQ